MEDAAESFRQALLEKGVLFDSGIEGLYGFSVIYEEVLAALQALVSRSGSDQGAVAVHFPPLLPRRVFEQTDYLRSFPQLTGSVHTFSGSDRAHAELLALLEGGEDWSRTLVSSEIVLRPAACHPLYPVCAGMMPEGGKRFEVHGWCFRHEPSLDPARMQAFRMHEFVYIGDPANAVSHRDSWVERGVRMLTALGLEASVVNASDPFFGRVGKLMAANQQDQQLKLEVVAIVTSEQLPTAVMSGNCHQDHFGAAFDITSADGAVAHSSCFGFGLDRIVLALLRLHGLEPENWPQAVREQLWP